MAGEVMADRAMTDGAMAGGCLCGAVRFTLSERPRDPVACHCRECRRQSGHVWAAASAPRGALGVAGEVRWFRDSAVARRGFCPVCGSLMFWDPDGEDRISIAVGAFDEPHDLRLRGHVWVSEQGSHHEIGDALPRRER